MVIFIHVSKQEYYIVVENLSQLIEATSNSAIEVIKDLSLNKGDCIIETPFGNVDSSFDMQFEAIKNDLIYILENR
jgi:flagellar assembly protein FliH